MADKYAVYITKTVQKQLSKMPDKIATQLEDKMLQLEDNPRPHGYEILKGRDGYRIRQGSYRILYEVKDDILVVIVLKVGNRKDVYR